MMALTLVLTAGMPMELVRLVTGHQTVDTVLKYYFKPRREGLRKAIEKAMPNLLTNGSGTHESKEDQIRKIVADSRASSAWEDI